MKQLNSTPNNTSDPMLQPGHVVKDKWQVVEKLGQGAFGEVYKCTELKRNLPVALKLVSKEQGANRIYLLKLEATVLKEIRDNSCFPKFIGFGKTERFDYLVMEQLGANLSELRKQQPGRKFSLSTMLRLGKMMLECIHTLHKLGFLHCDIKPSNFTIGLGDENRHKVYLLDFGLVRQYVCKGAHVKRPYRKILFQGTPRYASLRVLKGKESGRQDDLISLFYSLFEMSFKELPWKNTRDYKEVALEKEKYDHLEIIREFPSEFEGFYKHINQLEDIEKPDYDFLFSVFDCCIKRRGVKDSDPFDFDETENNLKIYTTTTASEKSPSNVVLIEELDNCENFPKNCLQRSYRSASTQSQYINVFNGDTRNEKLLKCKSSDNVKNFNRRNSYNLSHDTGFSASQLDSSSNYQMFGGISSELDSPVEKTTEKTEPCFKFQVSVESNKSNLSQQTESLFADSLLKDVAPLDTSKKTNLRIRNDFSKFFRKDSSLNKYRYGTGLSFFNCKTPQTKNRHPVRRSVSHPTTSPSYLSMKSIFNNSKRKTQQGLPRCWSCPTISHIIRSDLKPPLKQQASFDENVYEVDVMRNVAAKQANEVFVQLDSRRNSLPYVSCNKTSVNEHKSSVDVSRVSQFDKFSSNHDKNISDGRESEIALDAFDDDKTSCPVKSIKYKNATTDQNVMHAVHKSLSDSNVLNMKIAKVPKFCYNWINETSNTKNEPEKSPSTHLDVFELSPNKHCKSSDNCEMPNAKIESEKCLLTKSNAFTSSSNNPFEIPENYEKKSMITKSEQSPLPKKYTSTLSKGDNCKPNVKTESGKCPEKLDYFIPSINNHCYLIEIYEERLKSERSGETNPEATFNKSNDDNSLHTLEFHKAMTPEKTLNCIDSSNTMPRHLKEDFFNAISEKEMEDVIRQSKAMNMNSQNHLQKTKDQVENELKKSPTNWNCNNFNYHTSTLQDEISCEGSKTDTENPTPDRLTFCPEMKEVTPYQISKSKSQNFVTNGENLMSMVVKSNSFHIDHNNNEAKAIVKTELLESGLKTNVTRRQRCNSENKYVKDESELNLHFVRRRQRPSSQVFETEKRPQSSGNGMSYQIPFLIVSSMENSGHSRNIELPPELTSPPPGDPPPNHCLPSRRVRYRVPVESLTSKS